MQNGRPRTIQTTEGLCSCYPWRAIPRSVRKLDYLQDENRVLHQQLGNSAFGSKPKSACSGLVGIESHRFSTSRTTIGELTSGTGAWKET